MKSVYEKLYVRTKQDAPFSTEHPLAIMTYYENDAKFEKRKQTCDEWAGGRTYDSVSRRYVSPNPPDAEKHLIDNEYLEGFKIDDVRSRCSTDNKVFEILDPRGFKMQIYTDNLIELILNHTIINGVIQGKFCWGREDSKNILLSEAESNKIIKAVDKKIEIGSAVQLTNNSRVFTYLGKRSVVLLDHHKRYEYDRSDGSYKTLYFYNFFNNPSRVFLFAYKDEKGRIFIHHTKSLVKHTVVDDAERLVELSEIKESVGYPTSTNSTGMIAITDDKNYQIPYDEYYENLKNVYWGTYSKYFLTYKGIQLKVEQNEILPTT